MKTKIKVPPMFDWIEYAAAEPLIDNPTEWVCPCGGGIVERIFEEDLYCWDCCTHYEVIK